MCFLSCACRLVFFIYGTLGPAYYTYKTLNNGDNDFLAWAKYWIVYAFLVTIELLTDALLSWVAVYMPVKLFLMLWIVLSAPSANVWIFDSILHPFLTKRQEQIDQFINRSKYKVLNESFDAVSLMCVRAGTFLRPLISQWWSKPNMVIEVPNNLESLTGEGGAAAQEDQDSDTVSASIQTSRLNLCTRSSPRNSFTHITENSDDVQPVLGSTRSFNNLADNTISPEPSTSTVRRQVPRIGKMIKMSKTESGGALPSPSILTTQKRKLYDDVEEKLATSRIESDGQDVRQHRQSIASRNRPAIPQE